MNRMAEASDNEAKQFSPTADATNLYVVRPSIVGGRYSWAIQVDGELVGAVAEHTFLLLTLRPGSHEFAVKTGENRHAITVNASPGENQFIEVVPKIGWSESRAELRAVHREQGETAVRGSRRVDIFSK